MDQITMFDLKPKKYKTPMWPEFDKCYRTCRHFLPLDCYLNCRKKRCSYRGDGTSDRQVISMLIDNKWHNWCKYYEEEL